MQLILTKEQIDLLEIGSKLQIRVNEEDFEDDKFETWYYFPFWMKKIEDDVFEMVHFESLSENIKNLINKERNEE